MLFIQEVTEWNASFTVPNHIYYVNDSKTKMVGYIRSGTKSLVKFKKPIDLDRKGRKFEVVKIKGESDSVYFDVENKPTEPTKNTIVVEGSKGAKYFVTKTAAGYSCSCPGFGFRRKCKHVDMVKDAK
jgi:hypothetical protein